MKVLCFGSLNIDYRYTVPHFVRKGETLAAASLQVFSGGKGLNQAIALAKAGARVFQAGAIGPEGKFLTEELAGAGVDTRWVKLLPDHKCGHAIIQNDASGDNCILIYGGANRAISARQIKEVLADFAAGDWLVLQNEINALPEIIREASRKGLIIAFTPAPLDQAVLSYPLDLIDYLLLNELEAGQLAGLAQPAAASELAEALLKKFPKQKIVLTLGSRGSVYGAADCFLQQKAYSVKAVDTTAAGDTFAGFFIAALMGGKSEAEALDLAARAAAVAVTRAGAAPSVPSLAEVEAFAFSP